MEASCTYTLNQAEHNQQKQRVAQMLTDKSVKIP